MYLQVEFEPRIYTDTEMICMKINVHYFVAKFFSKTILRGTITNNVTRTLNLRLTSLANEKAALKQSYPRGILLLHVVVLPFCRKAIHGEHFVRWSAKNLNMGIILPFPNIISSIFQITLLMTTHTLQRCYVCIF